MLREAVEAIWLFLVTASDFSGVFVALVAFLSGLWLVPPPVFKAS